jgi:hypothetical protein
MNYELFTKIVDKLHDVGCRRFTPFRVNEPLLFPDLFRWLDYFRQKSITCPIFTNASNLNNVGSRLFDYSDVIECIHISFHGANKQEYEYNMGLDFDKIRNGIVTFMESHQKIDTHVYILERSTIKSDINEFQNLWKDMGFASVTQRGSVEWGGECDDPDTMRKYMTEKNLRQVPCVRLMTQLDIQYNGLVVLCCLDAHGKVVFGDLSYQSIDDILNNPIRQMYLERHQNYDFNLPLCKNCSNNLGEI